MVRLVLPRLLRLLLACSLVAATLIAVTNWAVVSAGTSFAGRSRAAERPYDVAIVLGCHVGKYGPTPMLAARLEEGLRLYRAGQVRQILVTGNGAVGETTAMKNWLTARHVPAADVIVDDSGTRTLNSARNAAKMGVRSAVVCTQPLHLARSLFLVRGSGIDAVGSAAAIDPDSLRQRGVETLKRTLAFAELELGSGLEAADPVVAAN
jgi:vancomycin permeability regulator SanA